MMTSGKINPAAMITHIGGLNAVVDTTLNLPNIRGGKKLIYTQIELPLTAIADFAKLGETDPLFAKLAEIISRVSFAAHELKLYLDLNPNDNSMLALYNDYENKCRELTDIYEKRYGALNSNSKYLNKVPFNWVEGIWPWEEKFNV